MGMRTGNRDVKHLSRKYVRRRSTTTHNCCSACPHATGNTLGTTQSEFGHGRIGFQAHACRLGGHQRLEVHAIEQGGFKQLALHDGSAHANQRFIGKNGRTFNYGVDVDAQLKVAQPVEKFSFKKRAATRRLQLV